MTENLLDGRPLAQMDNAQKGELSRIALQGLVSSLACDMWTPENAAKMTILSKVIETGTAEQREQLRNLHIQKVLHSLMVLTTIDIVYPISQLQMPEIMSQMTFVEMMQEEDEELPPNLEGN